MVAAVLATRHAGDSHALPAAVSVAHSVSAQPADFGQPVVQEQPGQEVLPVAPSQCTPFSSSNFQADYFSPFYDVGTGGASGEAQSDVLVMGSASTATSIVRTVDQPGYWAACYQPAFDQVTSQTSVTTRGGTECGLSLIRSTVGPLPPGTPDTITGTLYTSFSRCRQDGTITEFHVLVLNETVGRIVLQLEAYSMSPDVSPWVPALDAMRARAEAAHAG